ncbi:MAG: pitrilysin family protein [Pseudomonadota bacterium]
MKNLIFLTISTGWVFFTTENNLMATQAYCPIPTHTTGTEKSSDTLNVKDFTLKDGQTVWYTSDAELDIITVGLCFQYAGNQSDPKDKPGLSEFLTAMLDEGAGPYDSQAFKKKLIEKNIHMSISSNHDSIVIVFRTVSANINDAFQLIKLALIEPSFSNDAHTRVGQEITAALMQSLYKPEVHAKEKMLSSILGEEHVYAKDTKKQLQALPTITTADLAQHLKNTLTQANLKIAAAGNIEEPVLKKCLEDLTSALPKGEKREQTTNGTLKNPGEIIHETMDIPQTIVMFAHPGIDRKDPDFYAAYLLVQALGGNAFESRLWKEIREKRGLSYYISLGLFNHQLQYGMLGVTGTKTASVQEVIRLIKEQWQDVATNSITEAELSIQKQFIIESYPLSFTKTSDIVKTLLSYQKEGLSKNYVNEREELFRKVSVADIKRVAKKLLKSNELTFLIVGKKE